MSTIRSRRVGLDDVDRALLDALSRTGRASNIELARQVGVSEKTIRLRLARLEDDFGLAVAIRLADRVPGSRMIFLVRTVPAQRRKIATELAKHAEVASTYVTTGSADVVVVADFVNDAEALQFQVQVVESHPGVRSVSTCHLIAEVGRDTPTGDPHPAVDGDVLGAVMLGSSRATVADVESAIFDAVIGGLGADRALIVSSAPGKAMTRAPSVRGISQIYLDALKERVERGTVGGVIARVWDTRMHVFVSDARSDPLMAAAHDLVVAEGYVSLLTLPMVYGDSLVGTVSLYYDQMATLDTEYLGTAQAVADHFAVGLARAIGLAPPMPSA